jgi:hypothetical protein
MAKAILRIGYTDYVMDMADAVVVMEAFGKAEAFKSVSDYKSTPSTTSYHIWAPDPNHDQMTLQLLHDTTYKIAKLAGKPKE